MPPRKLDHLKESPLERQHSNRDSGATVEDTSEGVPKQMCISRVSVRKSRPSTRRSNQLYARSSTTVASNTERASCESTRARAPATVEYGNRLERIRRRQAQGRRPPPDAGTGTRAFNAPGAFSPNPSVTGSVIWNRHPSRRSFCSLPHQISQSMAGHREWVGMSNQDPP